jgi:F0F1-type ATP synthase membrane subunit b/b'
VGETTDELRREIEATRADITRDVDALSYKASPSRIVGDRVDRTQSRLTGVKDRVFGTAQDAGSGVSSAASSAAGSVQSAASTTADAVTSAPDVARRQAEGNPLAAGLIAFGIGWLVSSLIPPSEAETRAAEQVSEAAKEHAKPVLDEARQAASEVGENLREPAREAVESVKSTAQQGAQEVKDQGASSAQEVKEQVRSSNS